MTRKLPSTASVAIAQDGAKLHAPAASQLLADLVRGVTPALPGDLVAQLLPDRLRN